MMSPLVGVFMSPLNTNDGFHLSETITDECCCLKIGCIGSHAHGHEVKSLQCLSDLKCLSDIIIYSQPDTVAQLVASLIADPEVMSLIPGQPHTFVEIDHELLSMATLLLLIQERLLSVTSKSMCTEYW